MTTARADTDTILEMYDAGWSMSYIAQLLDISKHTVRACLIRHNCPIRSRTDYESSCRLSHEEAYKTMLMYRDGEMTIREIAEKLGKARSTVQYRLVRMGVPRRSKTWRSRTSRTR